MATSTEALVRMPSRAARRTSAVTPALPPLQANRGVESPATMSMSLDRAERTSPDHVGELGVEDRRQAGDALDLLLVDEVGLVRPVWGRELMPSSIFTTIAGWFPAVGAAASGSPVRGQVGSGAVVVVAGAVVVVAATSFLLPPAHEAATEEASGDEQDGEQAGRRAHRSLSASTRSVERRTGREHPAVGGTPTGVGEPQVRGRPHGAGQRRAPGLEPLEGAEQARRVAGEAARRPVQHDVGAGGLETAQQAGRRGQQRPHQRHRAAPLLGRGQRRAERRDGQRRRGQVALA